MLINNTKENNKHVKFIDYTGFSPNLCRGTLILEIDGIEWVFSHYEDRFWSSGGSCGFSGSNYTNSYINKGEWIIDVNKLPEEIRCYAAEIDEVFNENVPYGCCGGCL